MANCCPYWVHSICNFENENNNFRTSPLGVYLEKIRDFSIRNSNRKIFFRGVTNCNFIDIPSIYHKDESDRFYYFKKENSIVKDKEKCMIEEAIRNFPDEFPHSMPLIEKLAKLQHYELATRLMDVSSNALVGLYFACQDDPTNNDKCGAVYMYAVEEDNIFSINSDTATILAHLSLMGDGFKVSSCGSIKQLLHSIQQDRPQIKEVERDALHNIILVKVALNNPRIIRQEGAFLLFGIQNTKDEPMTFEELGKKEIKKSFERDKIIIPHCRKKMLLKELELLGISERTLFPEMEQVFSSIKKI